MLIRKVTPYAISVMESGATVCFTGGSGIGKTQLNHQIFDRIWRNSHEHWGFNSHIMSSWNPSDVLGPQYKGNREFEGRTFTISDPAMPLWMWFRDPRDDWKLKPAWAFDRVYLFLDEYGQLDIEVKKPLDPVLLDRRLGEWELPARSYVALATNVGSAYGVTKNMYQSMARMVQIPLMTDKKSLELYFEKPYFDRKTNREWTVSPLFRAYNSQRHDKVTEPEPKEITQWCNPRSFLAADRGQQTYFGSKTFDASDEGIVELLGGFVGKGVGADIVGFAKFKINLPQYVDVIRDPEGTKVPEKADERYLMLYQLAHDVEPERFGAVIKYMERFPADMAVPFVRAVIARDPGMFGAHPALMKWSDKNATLNSLLTSLGG